MSSLHLWSLTVIEPGCLKDDASLVPDFVGFGGIATAGIPLRFAGIGC